MALVAYQEGMPAAGCALKTRYIMNNRPHGDNRAVFSGINSFLKNYMEGVFRKLLRKRRNDMMFHTEVL
jgi:hypothetical protein